MTAGTRGDPLLGWLEAPRGDRAVRFAQDEGGWLETTYDELATLVRRGAARLRDHTAAGALVAIVLSTGAEFVATFFGTLYAGLTPCPIAPPGYFQDIGSYTSHLARILAVARPPLVVCARELHDVVTQAAHQAGLEREPIVLDLRDGASAEAPERPAELGLLQFTSGSTGTPKGARVTRRNLEANLEMMVRQIAYDGRERAASWLPLYHDMGLIGILLQGVRHQGDLWLLRPDQFVRMPERWIDCFGRHGCTLTAAPTFAFAYASKRVRAEHAEGLDLSGWRVAVMGAERVDAASLHAFGERFARHGFQLGTFMPAYGMAEATLAITLTPMEEIPSLVRLDRTALHFGDRLRLERATLADAPRLTRPTEWLAGSGRPLEGTSVAIVDDHGDVLDDGCLGEIVVESDSVVDGYVGSAASTTTAFRDGRLHTGDAGFVDRGTLYVLGRIGDALSIHGRNVYLEDLEARLGSVEGMPKGRFVVLAGPDRVVVLAERDPGAWAEEAAGALSRHVGAELGVSVLCVGRGAIERTSSGKPRRREMWQRLLEGRLAGQPVVSREPSPLGGREVVAEHSR